MRQEAVQTEPHQAIASVLAAGNLGLGQSTGEQSSYRVDEVAQVSGDVGEPRLLELNSAAFAAERDGGAKDDVLLAALGNDGQPLTGGWVQEQAAHLALLTFAQAVPLVAPDDVAVVAEALRLVAPGHDDALGEGPGAGDAEVSGGSASRLVVVHERIFDDQASGDALVNGLAAQPARASRWLGGRRSIGEAGRAMQQGRGRRGHWSSSASSHDHPKIVRFERPTSAPTTS